MDETYMRVKPRRIRRDPEPVDIDPDLEPLLLSNERRVQSRQSAHQHVALRFRSTNIICDLADLSETGAQLSLVDGAVPSLGEPVTLTLFDGTTIEGWVAWLEISSIGISFAAEVTEVDAHLDFEDLGSGYFGKAVNLQKSTRR